MKLNGESTTRVLLQNTVTSLYFCSGPEGWTVRFKQARDFRRVEEALEVVHREKLSDVQLVIVIERHGTLEFNPVQIAHLAALRLNQGMIGVSTWPDQ